MATLSDWPIPPFFTVLPGDEVVAPENCLLLLVDGFRVTGRLVRFAPSQSSLTVLPDGVEEERTIPLDQVKCVRLLRRLRIRRQETPLETRAEELFPASERQNYSVEFPDNEVIHGETLGYVNTRHGLYLFVPETDDGVMRHFYPRAAMRNYRIGLPIGEILVEEKVLSREAVDTALARQRELRTQRIGDYLTESRVVSREQLALAINHQEGKPLLRLGEALMQLGLITQGQLDTALVRQREDRSIPLGRILTGMGLLDENTLKDALARKLGIPFVGLAGFNFDPEAIRLVGASVARRRSLVPLCVHEGALVVAFEDPLDTAAIDEVRFLTQMRVIPAMASRDEISRAIGKHYGQYGARPLPVPEADSGARSEYEFHRAADVDIDKLASRLTVEDEALALTDEPAAESESILVQLVNRMILDAWSDGVSDIHIETFPGRKNTRVRFRKDGTLVDYTEIPSGSRNAIISRIKVMAQLDISERRKPQDGKLDFRQFGPADIELRVATIPTSNGLEDIVMRVLAASRPVAIEELRLAPDTLAHLKRLMERPYGLVLVCGPTGSGKTTTLHSLLGSINTPGRKIWTAEDPIEITQPGLRQVQVNVKIGWTFAAAMRSFLRADPDVIMVGEIRDAETARAGIEASLTGHLVLSTLHTNSAPESVVRLLDLGMDPFNFADALLAVLAQRLAKSLCPHCRQRYRPEAPELEELAAEYCDGTDLKVEATLKRWRDEGAATGGVALFRAPGCARCHDTGYLGRVGLHELLVMTPALRRLVQTRAPIGDLARAAMAGGMRTLKQDGIEKVLGGLTDIGKVRAVCS
ncbi:MAG TPA: ATPase, T2SS/T4P/T4SS family [Usitatibacteraceae bacterium]|nr:ATPase, T2SS/T4P/T4SS family [Usitatibacteraceae bacterium]